MVRQLGSAPHLCRSTNTRPQRANGLVPSPAASRFGVRIRGEAVVKGEHTLYLIAEAANESQLRRFLAPFEEVGSVDIFPACASDQPDPPKLRGSNDGEGCSHNAMVLAVCYHDSSGHVLLSIATY